MKCRPSIEASLIREIGQMRAGFLVIMLFCFLSDGIAADPATAPTSAPTQINVRDFGAKGDDAADDAPALNHAIDIAIKSGPGAVVFIPAGRYRLMSETNGVEYLSIRRAQGLTVRGEAGTVLIAEDPDVHILVLFANKDVKLSTLTLEQSQSSFTQGVIDSVDPNTTACDVTIDKDHDLPDAPDLAGCKGLRPLAISAKRFPQISSHKQISGRKWHFVLDGRLPEANLVGSKFVLLDERRRGHAIAGGNDEDCVMENITYYGKGANSAFYLAGCRGKMTFSRCLVTVAPGSDAMISCAGGGQFPNTRGSLVFEGCVFDKVLNDAVAIPTPYVRVVAQIDGHTLQLQRNPGFEPGDVANVVDWVKRTERGPTKVVSVVNKPDRSCVVTFDHDLDIRRAGAGDGKWWGADARTDGIDRVIDYSLACQSVVFRNCTMQSISGRAIDVKAQNCLIEGFVFRYP